MKKQIVCPECEGRGYITLTRMYNDYCGIGNRMCESCGGTGLQEADTTNADRIRAMSDGELADFLNNVNICDTRTNEECKSVFCAQCGECVLNWLQQPAEEATHG